MLFCCSTMPLTAGCQQVAVLDGRSYQFVGPRHLTTEAGDPTIEFTSGSAGGHVDTIPNPGVIRNPARFSILYVDKATGGRSYAVVTVAPDASVSVTPRTPLTSSATLEAAGSH